MVPICFDLVQTEGLLLGGSTGHQRRGRDPARARARAREDDRHDPLRLGLSLPVEAIQPCVPPLEGSTGTALARRLSVGAAGVQPRFSRRRPN